MNNINIFSYIIYNQRSIYDETKGVPPKLLKNSSIKIKQN